MVLRCFHRTLDRVGWSGASAAKPGSSWSIARSATAPVATTDDAPAPPTTHLCARLQQTVLLAAQLGDAIAGGVVATHREAVTQRLAFRRRRIRVAKPCHCSGRSRAQAQSEGRHMRSAMSGQFSGGLDRRNDQSTLRTAGLHLGSFGDDFFGPELIDARTTDPIIGPREGRPRGSSIHPGRKAADCDRTVTASPAKNAPTDDCTCGRGRHGRAGGAPGIGRHSTSTIVGIVGQAQCGRRGRSLRNRGGAPSSAHP